MVGSVSIEGVMCRWKEETSEEEQLVATQPWKESRAGEGAEGRAELGSTGRQDSRTTGWPRRPSRGGGTQQLGRCCHMPGNPGGRVELGGKEGECIWSC